MNQPLAFEALTSAHWEAVRAIYLEGIATRNATFEETAPAWEDWSAGHLAVGRLVALSAGEVAGWVALAPVSRRAVYRGVAEVSVYVRASARGLGVGRALLDRLIEASEAAGIWTLQAGILAENAASLRLHAQAGFRVVGARERIGCLAGVWRDVVLMERRSVIAGT